MKLYSFISVHPHGRGEHVEVAAAAAQTERFIPTDVGNTSGTPLRPAADAVHPHGRGEHATI